MGDTFFILRRREEARKKAEQMKQEKSMETKFVKEKPVEKKSKKK